jgi:hypothetical protein
MWNGQLYEWTPDSVSKGYRQQLREEFQILTYVQDGLLTGPNGAPFGDSHFIISCPPVQRLEYDSASPGSTSLASPQLLWAVRQASGARQTHLTFNDSDLSLLQVGFEVSSGAYLIAISQYR